MLRRSHTKRGWWEWCVFSHILYNIETAIASTNSYTSIELNLGYRFSVRNGFGPIPRLPPQPDDAPIQMKQARELAVLLHELTPAEEAAIRRVRPLVSIVCLSQGNMAAKGNTSCLFQKSKIGTILPHLPRECKYIVIQCQGPRGPTDIKSTKVRRSHIHRVLILLKDIWRGCHFLLNWYCSNF